MQPFSLLFALGALFGLLLVSWRAPQKERLRYLDAAVLTLLGALVGSRFLAALVNWAYYQNHPSEIFQVWRGDLSGIGALVGGILAMLVISRWWKLPLGALADGLLPLAGTLTITAWMGCWLDSCSYGLPASTWWAIPARDEWGVLASRVPVQLIGATLTLAFIWTLDVTSPRMPLKGMSAVLGLFAVSVIIFGLSYLQADPAPIWNGLRLEAWGALGLMIFSALLVVVLLVHWKFKK